MKNGYCFSRRGLLLGAAALAIGAHILSATAMPLFLRGGSPSPAGGGGSSQACDGGSSVCAQFQNGQSFVTWDDVGTDGAGGANTRYRVYRSTAPITAGNYASATLIASYVFNNSAQLFGGDPNVLNGAAFTQINRQSAAQPMAVLSDLGTALPAFSGLQVYTALAAQNAYYAVVSTDTSNANPVYIGSAGPIAESVADPAPIKYADSLSRTNDGGYGEIDLAVGNVPVVLKAHASSAAGGCPSDCRSGDYWEWFLTPSEGWQDGRATTLAVQLDKAQSYRQNTLVLIDRDTIWTPDGLGAMETFHQGIGMTPNPLVGAANRWYPTTASGIERMVSWALDHYGADPNQLHWVGTSMGAWGGANTGMRSTAPRFSAVWLNHPMWRMDLRSSGGWPGGTWSGTMPFKATVAAAPSTLGTTASSVQTSDGATWGGTGGYVDMPSFIAANPGTDLPAALWMISKYDGFATWAEQLAAESAFESAHRGFGFVWYIGAHDTSFPGLGLLDCDASGFDLSVCYAKSDFKLNAAYIAFSNSSIDDDPGTGGTVANGMFDGDDQGCINCGFAWNVTSDTAGSFAFTVDNTWMDKSPTPAPSTTLAGSIAASGGGSVAVTDGSVFQTVSTNPYFIVNGSEAIVVTSVVGNTVTYSTRAKFNTTASAHGAGETIRQFISKPTGPNGGPFSTMTVDITPRRIQGFTAGKTNGQVITCDITPFGGGTTQQTPTVSNTLFTLTGVTINATGATSVSCSAAATPVATQTIVNDSGSPLASAPYTGGMVFARGDIPGCLTGNYPIVKDSGGNTLVSQLDDVSTWDDGSCRHASYSVFMPAMASGATEQLQFYKQTGAYTPGTDSRTTADVTGPHTFTAEFTDVRACNYSGSSCHYESSPVGSGAFLASLDQMIADGHVDVVATGPVRHGLVVHGAALDETPTATTLGATINSSATGSTLVGSTASFPGSGTYIVKIGGEYLLASTADATHINFTARGATGSTAASHSSGATITLVGHFWLRWYVNIYTDPTNSAAVYGIAQMPLIMQPWMNVAGLDSTSYFASLNDGASAVRDWGITFSVAQSGTTINTTNDTIDLGASTLVEGECVSFASSGTLPSPLVADRPYWLRPSTGTLYTVYPDALGGSNGSGGSARVDIASAGSGTLTVTRRTCHSYREGWYSTADDAGNPNWTVTRPQLRPQLTVAERQYWETAGMVPPYDTTLTPDAWAGAGSIGDATVYRPTVAVSSATALGSAGAPPNSGPLPRWDAIAWLRQDATGWDQIRAAGLGKMHMPWVATLNEATGRVPVLNNGPDRVGGSYSGLGSPFPTANLEIVAGADGLLAPPGGLISGNNSQGNISQSGGSGSGAIGHRSLDPYLPALLTGEPWFLDGVYLDANGVIMSVDGTPDSFTSRRIARINNADPTYYAKIIFGNDGRTAGALKNIIVASVLGGSANREKTYFADVVDENLDFWEALQAIQAADQDDIGAMDVNTSAGADGLTSRWATWAWLYGKALTRDSRFDDILARLENAYVGRWDGSWGISPFYASNEYWSVFKVPVPTIMLPSSANGTWITNFGSWADVGIGTAGGSHKINFTGGGSAAATFPTIWTGMNLQDGDPIRIVTPLFGGGGTSITAASVYSGPPELEPLSAGNACGGTEQNGWFYIRNPSAGDGTNITIDGIACTPAGTPISIATASSNNTFTMRPQADPAGTINATGDPNAFAAIDIGNMCWMKALGVTGTDTALSNAQTRTAIPQTGALSYTSNPRYATCGNITVQ